MDIEVVPGMSALLAAAARIGAPLGHDFCVISLSDYLKPWAVIEQRLHKACEGDFVIVIYNPASKTRKEQLVSAMDAIRRMRGGNTVAMLASAVGRKDEQIKVTNLEEFNPADVSMKTLLIIGSSSTRCIEKEGRPFVYTPRYYKDAV
jgi:precorrin-3B C17-methyltransferase